MKPEEVAAYAVDLAAALRQKGWDEIDARFLAKNFVVSAAQGLWVPPLSDPPPEFHGE